MIEETYHDIEGHLVADLGCGCGVLSLTSLSLGCERVLAFDVDREVSIPEENHEMRRRHEA